MTYSWFNTPARRRALQVEASSWLGTPFFGNGNTKGVGVSCQKFASSVYRDVGCCNVDVPNVAMAHARFAKVSILEPFMDACQSFNRVPKDDIQPGDLLGFKIGKVIHHCGIYVGENQFIHAMADIGVVTGSITDATWSSRLSAVWRPKP